ncbi:LacI family DNA-binding transcriptional regulator [Clostridium paraputrificum]|uniref:LacI family DNA-binding transcriptional regulator n=1 Tax=Clostridium paraputrificum TaxID=29363 RepID=UPI0034A46B96
MKTIMQDIAKLAQVSPGTVSNALNNRKGVGKETKERILKIAEEVGYFKTQKKSEDKIIRMIKFKKHGYILSDTPFFSKLIESCERTCRNSGYELLITQVEAGKDTKEDIQKIFTQKRVDGTLLLGTEMEEEDFSEFENLNIPMVVVDTYFKAKDCDFVLINNDRGAYLATKYIIDRGIKDIGYIGSTVDISNFKCRKEGFFQSMKEHNLEVHEENMYKVEPTTDGAYRDFKDILSNENIKLPKALFAFNDIIALGAIKAMNEKGIKIPEDVSIVGFDDIPFSDMINPPMTTVRVDVERLGKVSINRLIEKIEEEDEGKLKVQISTDIVERKSVI